MRPLLLVALLLVGCRSRVAPPRESEVYGGVGVVGLPSVGAQVTGGQYFSKGSDKYDFAFELRAAVQGGDDSPTQDGGFYHLQAGVKQTTNPGHDRRLVFRYGLTWFRANGDPEVIDEPGDYLGAFAGAGYEWRLGERVWVGPEVTANWVNGEGSRGSDFLPQAGFSVYFDF
jgi:hypothetical protein